MLTVAVSIGARADELLGICGADVDWGDQLVRVVRKGTHAEQWLPVSPDTLTWIRLYLNDLGTPLDVNEPLWWTLRGRDRGDGLQRQRVSYETLRGVLRRANEFLGTNWTMHQTCATLYPLSFRVAIGMKGPGRPGCLGVAPRRVVFVLSAPVILSFFSRRRGGSAGMSSIGR